MDNRNHQRILSELLDHDATQEDIRRILTKVKSALDARGLRVQGITTDGSNLYPEVLAELFPGVPHQICEFHILQDLTKAVLRGVAQVRRKIASTMPKLRRGRPDKASRRIAARKKRLQQRVTDLFEHRHLFVQRHLTATERRKLASISRGYPHLRVLRQIMDEVYRLFDRRCRTETARSKLEKLRTRVRRFKSLSKLLKKLMSPNLEKALTFLDDRLLPATSNAVERTNRRHRKMQKSVYRVRTHRNLMGRIALDLQRERSLVPRGTAIRSLRVERNWTVSETATPKTETGSSTSPNTWPKSRLRC